MMPPVGTLRSSEAVNAVVTEKFCTHMASRTLPLEAAASYSISNIDCFIATHARGYIVLDEDTVPLLNSREAERASE